MDPALPGRSSIARHSRVFTHQAAREGGGTNSRGPETHGVVDAACRGSNGVSVRYGRVNDAAAGRGRTAGLIATVAFVVAGAADALPIVEVHQSWAASLAAVLILVPDLCLAWKAVPPQPRRTRSRHAAVWNAADLRVHQVAGGGRLPHYIRRAHDDVLDALLDPGVTASRLVVVRSESSRRKTGAAFERVTRGRVARWRLRYARGEAALDPLQDGI